MSKYKIAIKDIVSGNYLTPDHAVSLKPMMMISEKVYRGIATIQQIVDSLRILTNRKDPNVRYHAMVSIMIAREMKIVTEFQQAFNKEATESLLRCLPPPFDNEKTLYRGMQTDLVFVDGMSDIDQLVWGCEYLMKSSYYKDCPKYQTFQTYPSGPLIITQLLENYCTNVLVTDDGVFDKDKIDHLKLFVGVDPIIVDKGIYGPLIYGLQFPNGILAFS